jgi:SAM-dependent methyltransferase
LAGALRSVELSPSEAAYIDRQQGLHCARCGCNLRTMALARAVTRCFGFDGLFADFVRHAPVRRLRILEITRRTADAVPVGGAGHHLAIYPDADMMRLPFAAASFDLVLHSDTLEHVESPVAGLSECRRVLTPGGVCASPFR